ncbi:hypothetical protein IFM89_023105 [Coptis chinensis]|uniref:IBH1-like N-terminal domain-containing protein n=1 Tax=Coptis chinensis TaxID=261450 RepID=A0A835LV33_9MAGN|nr:hypothetical protein IFM89_023105 [Coptis chinensis]
MDNQKLSTNPTSLKTRFALRFIRSLTRIKMANTPVSSMGTLRKRSQTIKLAADCSMASAVGSKRSWSRSALLKIRSRARLHAFAKEKVVTKKKKKCNRRDVGEVVIQQEVMGANELRQIVPGGESMEFLNLLKETAHYIKCLNTQVEVMQNIVDLYSPST